MKRWVPIDDQCGECGTDAEVFTDAEQPPEHASDDSEWRAYDGDEVRCVDPECGATGAVSADPDGAWVNWGGA